MPPRRRPESWRVHVREWPQRDRRLKRPTLYAPCLELWRSRFRATRAGCASGDEVPDAASPRAGSFPQAKPRDRATVAVLVLGEPGSLLAGSPDARSIDLTPGPVRPAAAGERPIENVPFGRSEAQVHTGLHRCPRIRSGDGHAAASDSVRPARTRKPSSSIGLARSKAGSEGPEGGSRLAWPLVAGSSRFWRRARCHPTGARPHDVYEHQSEWPEAGHVAHRFSHRAFPAATTRTMTRAP